MKQNSTQVDAGDFAGGEGEEGGGGEGVAGSDSRQSILRAGIFEK